MTRNGNFFNLYNHDFMRIAVGVPSVRVADPAYNSEQTIALIRDAAERKAVLALFPELGLSAYSCDDLFQQRALLDACLDAIAAVVEASSKLSIVSVVGAPLQIDNHLYNCAIVIHRGKILGVVPKTNLPNYREFYEPRQFTSADAATRDEIDLAGESRRPVRQQPDLPARGAAVAHFPRRDLRGPVGADSAVVVCGARRSDRPAESVGIEHHDWQGRLQAQLVMSQSARCLAAYAYSAAGEGESTTDLAWDGHALIAENGNILAESERFKDQPQVICAEIDLERLSQERMRQNTFGDTAQREHDRVRRFRRIAFSTELPRRGKMPLQRRYERFPYVPSDPATRDERCAEVFDIQVQGLATRLRSTGLDRVVIGVSGGIDSTHALLVCARAMDRLGSPRKKILAVTMPGFATTARTLEQARRLMKSLGCSTDEIDIRPSCMQMLKDIGHPYAEGKQVYDVTFENVQAGERTSHLFRLANLRGGLVVGTGDLSELALGWCTYGVGDHMSHYSVNASVPKTLIQHVIRWLAQTGSPRARDQRDADRDSRDADQSRADSRHVGGRAFEPRHRGDDRSIRAARFFSLLHAALRISAAEGRVPRVQCVARQERGRLAGHPARSPQPVRHRDYQGASAHVPVPVFPVEPVQAQHDSQCAQGRFGRIAVAARRLARAVGQRSDRMARAIEVDPRQRLISPIEKLSFQ